MAWGDDGLHKRGDRWHLSYRDSDGTLREKSTRQTDYRKALEFKREFDNKLVNGELPTDMADWTLQKAVDKDTEHRKATSYGPTAAREARLLRPVIALPPYLVETKWSRCAMVRGNAAPDVPTYRWYWNPEARIASPPGIACFRAGSEYSHGGVSLQECVVPEILVERATAGITAQIALVQWRGMRCRVTVQASGPGVMIDLRTNFKQPKTSIVAAAKEANAAGEVSLVVEDDQHEGSSATLVAIDSAGNVLDRQLTTVGDKK